MVIWHQFFCNTSIKRNVETIKLETIFNSAFVTFACGGRLPCCCDVLLFIVHWIRQSSKSHYYPAFAPFHCCTLLSSSRLQIAQKNCCTEADHSAQVDNIVTSEKVKSERVNSGLDMHCGSLRLVKLQGSLLLVILHLYVRLNVSLCHCILLHLYFRTIIVV